MKPPHQQTNIIETSNKELDKQRKHRNGVRINDDDDDSPINRDHFLTREKLSQSIRESNGSSPSSICC